jgi:RNA polymerase sigma factor for flagellar operon FliA
VPLQNLKTAGNNVIANDRRECGNLSLRWLPLLSLGQAYYIPHNNRGERRILLNRLENILQEVELERGYERLTKRERNIISLYYLEGYKDKEIASFYGITQQVINRLRKKGINKLKIF